MRHRGVVRGHAKQVQASALFSACKAGLGYAVLRRSEPGSQSDCSFAASTPLIIVGVHSCCCNGQDHRNLSLVLPRNCRDALHELLNFPIIVGLGGPARAVLLALGKRCFLWPVVPLLSPYPAASRAPRPSTVPGASGLAVTEALPDASSAKPSRDFITFNRAPHGLAESSSSTSLSPIWQTLQCNVCQTGERLVLELSAKPCGARLNVMKSRDGFALLASGNASVTARPLAPSSTKFSPGNSGTPTNSVAGLPARRSLHLSPASSSRRLYPRSEPEANLRRDRQLHLLTLLAHLLPADTPRTSTRHQLCPWRHLGSHLDQATTQTPAGMLHKFMVATVLLRLRCEYLWMS